MTLNYLTIRYLRSTSSIPYIIFHTNLEQYIFCETLIWLYTQYHLSYFRSLKYFIRKHYYFLLFISWGLQPEHGACLQVANEEVGFRIWWLAPILLNKESWTADQEWPIILRIWLETDNLTL